MFFFSSSLYLCYLDLNKLRHPLFPGQNLTSCKTGPLPTIQKHFQTRSMVTHHFLSHQGAALVLCYIMCSLSKQTIGFTSCLSIPCIITWIHTGVLSRALRSGTTFLQLVWTRVCTTHTEQGFTQELTHEGLQL